MSKYTSKIGKINKSDQLIYNFLTDFNNIKSVIPEDKVKDFEATEDTCRFSVDAVGQAGLKIIEKESKNKSPEENLYDSLMNGFIEENF